MPEVTIRLHLPTKDDVERFIRTVIDEFPVKLEVETAPEPKQETKQETEQESGQETEQQA